MKCIMNYIQLLCVQNVIIQYKLINMDCQAVSQRATYVYIQQNSLSFRFSSSSFLLNSLYQNFKLIALNSRELIYTESSTFLGLSRDCVPFTGYIFYILYILRLYSPSLIKMGEILIISSKQVTQQCKMYFHTSKTSTTKYFELLKGLKLIYRQKLQIQRQ